MNTNTKKFKEGLQKILPNPIIEDKVTGRFSWDKTRSCGYSPKFLIDFDDNIDISELSNKLLIFLNSFGFEIKDLDNNSYRIVYKDKVILEMSWGGKTLIGLPFGIAYFILNDHKEKL